MHINVLKIIEKYLKKYPDEQLRLKTIIGSLQNNLDVWNRKTMTGHLTGSGIVFDKRNQKFLILEHRALKRWLVPGGHIDAGELPEDAALRETREESGIQEKPISSELIDIDVHLIPERKSKNEGAHNHFDFRYLFIYDTTPTLNVDMSESCQSKWVGIDFLKQDYPEAYAKLKERDLSSLQ